MSGRVDNQGSLRHIFNYTNIISLIHDLSQNNDKNIQTDLIIMDFVRKSFRQGTTQKTAVQNEILWHIRTNHKLG